MPVTVHMITQPVFESKRSILPDTESPAMVKKTLSVTSSNWQTLPDTLNIRATRRRALDARRGYPGLTPMRLTSLVAGVVALLLAPPSRAETAPFDAGCGTVAPMIPASLPANVPGVVFYGYSTTLLTDVALLAPDGTTVPTTLMTSASSGTAILGISEALLPDRTYTLRWTDGCEVGKTKTFNTTAAAPLPTAAGTVTVTELRPPTMDARCIFGKPDWPAQRNVIFAEDPAVIPFLPVAKVEVVADGKVESYSVRSYGAYADSDPWAGVLHQSCPAPPRTVRVAVRVQIANGPTVITPEITTELRCLESLPWGCPDAGVMDTGVDTASDIGVDSSIVDSSEPADTSIDLEDSGSATFDDDTATKGSPRDDVIVGGCTCGVPTRVSMSPWWIALMALPLARRRARRTAACRRTWPAVTHASK